jgi:nitrilase
MFYSPAPMGTFRLAAVQAAPVYLDPDASADKACSFIEQAGALGAQLVAFGETWLPGYPRFVNSPVDIAVRRRLTARYLGAAVEVPGPITHRLCAAARDAGTDVMIGVAELDPVTRGSTYCTLLLITADGTIAGRHRKLKPTSSERTVWGEGDGTGLRVHSRDYAAVSGLNCWEHNMVLPGYALMAEGTQVHVAAFPGYEPAPPTRSSTRQLLLARAFASQAAAYVILVGGLLRPQDAADPEVSGVLATLPPLTGDSAIIDPTGEVIVQAAAGEETIIVADASLDAVRAAKAICDVGGHYSRPDVLKLWINRQPLGRLIEEPAVEAER